MLGIFDELPYPARVLASGATFDAARRIDGVGAHESHRLRDVVRAQAAREIEAPRRDPERLAPVERDAAAARGRVEEHPGDVVTCDRFVDRAERVAHPQRLYDRDREASAVLGRFVAVQLDRIETDGG